MAGELDAGAGRGFDEVKQLGKEDEFLKQNLDCFSIE